MGPACWWWRRDAPVDARNLRRMAERAISDGAHRQRGEQRQRGLRDCVSNGAGAARLVGNEAMSPLLLGTIEAAEEAIYNSLLRAVTVTGNGRTVEAIPLELVREALAAAAADRPGVEHPADGLRGCGTGSMAASTMQKRRTIRPSSRCRAGDRRRRGDVDVDRHSGGIPTAEAAAFRRPPWPARGSGIGVGQKRTGRGGPAPKGEELAHPAGPKRVRCARFLRKRTGRAGPMRVRRVRRFPTAPASSPPAIDHPGKNA
jgi:hypothetical protein